MIRHVKSTFYTVLSTPMCCIDNRPQRMQSSSGDLAYLTEIDVLEHLVESSECDTYMLAEEVFNSGGLAFVLPQGQAFLAAFNDM